MGRKRAVQEVLPPEVPATAPTADDLIKRHQDLNNHCKAQAKAFAEFLKPSQDEMRAIENQLLDRLNQQGLDKVSSEHGTAYTSEIMSPKVEDFDKALDFALENWDTIGNDMVKVAPKVERMRQYMQENEGALPPGITATYMINLNIRKS